MNAAVKYPLEPEKDRQSRPSIAWTSCAPFVENPRGVLIHRPRRVIHYQNCPRWASHLAINFHCGMTTTGGRELAFLDAPPESAIVCHVCELKAVAKGLPPSSVIAGRHVHIGGVRAYKICCEEK